MCSLWLIAAHMLGDYVFQNDWMAANNLKDPFVRLVHVVFYSLCFLPVLVDQTRHAGCLVIPGSAFLGR